MATSRVTYMGDLMTKAVHLKSGSTIITDAPVDNNGKGSAFSPTDLVATAVASCMITIMGMWAEKHDININGTTIDVTKVMSTEPRRIGEIILEVKFPEGLNLTDKDKTIIERAGNTCPVLQSLHPDIKKSITFIY